ncbi:glycosyltransferase family 4 protein [Paenibacillus oenotherae]|uniref:Glycosyltransferase family 4 protein n=1 Tax=Paenibacillus oenotherae TaxID=1435645 RepID=A0ABS7D975_9BACL|nr:glycosyltransferase family 4 protein [Paenibacillus oenotherae]MBW7476494.1 glycosyltransferase family 4 protein [Paenibacillus oenotherae]
MNPRLRVGYISGQAKRVNERVIDTAWLRYLGQYVELIEIPPLSYIKLFGGTFEKWLQKFPESLDKLSANLKALQDKYRLDVFYANLTPSNPYIVMARNHGQLDLGILMIAHCVGSENWVRHWLAMAPFLTEKDVLLASTATTKRALECISDVYKGACQIPLCTDADGLLGSFNEDGEPIILSIGRIENVKNIDAALRCFADISARVPGARLVIAGEYTGRSEGQVRQYREQLEGLVQQYGLQDTVTFTGSIVGAEKEACFRSAALLLNLSTDPGETFGYNIVEAKRYGLPVVCTDWDGFRDIVRHGEDGFLADCFWEGDKPSIDEAQVADYCVQLLTDSGLRRRMHGASLLSMEQFHYRKVMPLVEEAVYHASERVVLYRKVDEVWNTPISEQGGLYCLDNLRGISFLDASPLSVLSEVNTIALEQWYGQVKPLIGHFASANKQFV